MSDALSRGALALMAALSLPAYSQSGLGDPTRPTSLSEPGETVRSVQAPRWRLQSTLVADDRRVAVINGRAVSQGQSIDGATVLEVRADGVTLLQNGRRVVLDLPGRVEIRRGG